MALEQKLSLKLSQRLIMTPSLQQAIRLLQMTKLELQEEVTQELTENPLLEESQETQEEERTRSRRRTLRGPLGEKLHHAGHHYADSLLRFLLPGPDCQRPLPAGGADHEEGNRD